jgi:hypothetical protein
MKRITKTEEGYLLNDYQARQIKKHSLKMFRNALFNLVHIGLISHKEKAEIEFFADKIFYKEYLQKAKTDKVKGGKK